MYVSFYILDNNNIKLKNSIYYSQPYNFLIFFVFFNDFCNALKQIILFFKKFL